MIAALLQGVGLVGLPVGGIMIADAGGGIVGLSISAIFVGLALENR